QLGRLHRPVRPHCTPLTAVLTPNRKITNANPLPRNFFINRFRRFSDLIWLICEIFDCLLRYNQTQHFRTMRQKILFIGGSLNQTKMAHAVARHLMDDYDCAFTPLYADAGLLRWLSRRNLLNFTVLGW